jgi:hypothetical protein
MKKHKNRRPRVAIMLIISAIDVLICSFTAGLTLFFLATGATHVNGTGQSSLSNSSAAFEFLMVNIGTDGKTSAVVVCGEKQQYLCNVKRVPRNATEVSKDVVIVTDELPSPSRPLVIGPTQPVDFLEWDISVSAAGKITKTHLRCVVKGGELFMVIPSDRPIKTLSGCREPEDQIKKGHLKIQATSAQKFFIVSCDDDASLSDCVKQDQSSIVADWPVDVTFVRGPLTVAIESQTERLDMLVQASVPPFNKSSQIRCENMQAGNLYRVVTITDAGDLRPLSPYCRGDFGG